MVARRHGNCQQRAVLLSVGVFLVTLVTRNNKFWEDTVALFPSIRHGPHTPRKDKEEHTERHMDNRETHGQHTERDMDNTQRHMGNRETYGQQGDTWTKHRETHRQHRETLGQHIRKHMDNTHRQMDNTHRHMDNTERHMDNTQTAIPAYGRGGKKIEGSKWATRAQSHILGLLCSRGMHKAWGLTRCVEGPLSCVVVVGLGRSASSG
jgi:hypothetical protein